MSLGASFLDNFKTAETGSLRAISKLIASGQVLTGLAVSQRGAGANMSVDISTGDAFLMRSAGDYGYHVFNDAVYNQAVTTADPSNPRNSVIVIYRDTSAAGNTTVSNAISGAVKIAIVNGTPAATPLDPTTSAIQTAIGSSSYPYAILGRITLPAAASSVTNSMITDLRSFAYSAMNNTPTKLIVPSDFSVYRNAAFTGATGDNFMVYDTKEWDYGSNYSTTTGRFTASVPGKHDFSAALNAAINNGGWSSIAIAKNGTIAKGGNGWNGYVPGSNHTMSVSVQASLDLVAGDYVQIVWTTNGVPIYPGSSGVWFQGHLRNA